MENKYRQTEMLLRVAIGGVLREIRTEQHKTLRQVCTKVPMALGYLSEVERGEKELSSELLADLACVLGVSTTQILMDSAVLMSAETIPDYLPGDLLFS